MAIFTVLALDESTSPAQKITEQFSEANYKVSPLSWLISFQGTTQELSKKLGLLEPSAGLQAVITRVESYHGLAPNPIWEWIKTKWESGANG